MSRRWRLPIAILALAAYLVILFGSAWLPHDMAGLIAGIADGVSLQYVAAALLCLAAGFVFGWRELSLGGPRPWRSVLLVLPSLLYLVVFFGVALTLGLPPARAALFLAINLTLAAFAEELMFRGLLFRGLLTRLKRPTAIVLTSVIFGVAHVLNALATGDLATAAVQAVAAGMTGTFFLAIVLRTGSLWPAIAYHAAYDFTIALVAAGHAPPATAVVESHALAISIVPILLVLPNFLYALFLLRKAKADSPLIKT